MMTTETAELASLEMTSDAVQSQPAFTRPKRLRAFDLLLVMAVAFAPLIFSSTCAYFLRSPMEFSRWSVASLVLHESIALGVLAYVLLQQRRTLRDIGLQFKFSDLGSGILLAIGGMLASLLAQGAAYTAQPGGVTTSQSATADPASLGQLGLIAVFFVVLNPVFEELLVRGYFMSEVSFLTSRRWIPPVASTLLQGSYHLYQGIPSAIGVTACFLLWALYFKETRRLLPIILAHFLGDAYALFRST